MSMPATPRRPVEKIEVSPRLRYALDRHRSRAAWFRKAGKPAVDIARQFVGDPAFADASLPGSFGIPSRAAHSAVGHLIPFLALLTGWLPR
jgi:hypothetical protein